MPKTREELEGLATDVIRGKYSVGKKRRELLGDDYDDVQKIVNERYRNHTQNKIIGRDYSNEHSKKKSNASSNTSIRNTSNNNNKSNTSNKSKLDKEYNDEWDKLRFKKVNNSNTKSDEEYRKEWDVLKFKKETNKNNLPRNVQPLDLSIKLDYSKYASIANQNKSSNNKDTAKTNSNINKNNTSAESDKENKYEWVKRRLNSNSPNSNNRKDFVGLDKNEVSEKYSNEDWDKIKFKNNNSNIAKENIDDKYKTSALSVIKQSSKDSAYNKVRDLVKSNEIGTGKYYDKVNDKKQNEKVDSSKIYKWGLDSTRNKSEDTLKWNVSNSDSSNKRVYQDIDLNLNKQNEEKLKYRSDTVWTPNIRTVDDESYKNGHSLTNDKKGIVLHHTGIGFDETMNTFKTKGSDKSAHLVINKDGTKTVMANDDDVTFHAGLSRFKGRDFANDFMLGVEFVGNTQKKPLTDAQIESFAEYVVPKMKKYGWTLDDITNHTTVNKEWDKYSGERIKENGDKRLSPKKDDVVQNQLDRIKQYLSEKYPELKNGGKFKEDIDDKVQQYNNIVNNKNNSDSTELIKNGLAEASKHIMDNINPQKKVDLKQQQKLEDEINNSGDNLKIIQASKHNDNYAVVDKQKGKMTIYDKNNKILYSTNVLTGKSKNDYNTITYVNNSGKIINAKGNMSTPAGITEIKSSGNYHGGKSFQRVRINSDNSKEDIASSIHIGNTKSEGTNGCVRLDKKDLNVLNKYLTNGTKVYTLPEKEGSRFSVKNGKLNFIADNPYGDEDKSNPKKNWDNYNVTIDKSYSKLGIQRIVNSDDPDYDKNADNFASSLSNNKESIQKKFNLTSDEYNRLAQLAIGIASQETKFGTSIKYKIKENGQPLIDLLKNISGNKSANSRGFSQIKISADSKEMKDLYKDLGVNEDNIDNADKSAIATIARLAYMYNTEIKGKKFIGAKNKEVNGYDALIYKWISQNDKLKNHIAVPENNTYVKSVKKYQDKFKFYEPIDLDI